MASSCYGRRYHAVQEAVSRSAALRNPDDPRQIVFAILPGHDLIIVEKWMEGREAFQAIWMRWITKL